MLGAAVTVIAGGFLIARRHLSAPTSLAIAIVKAALPLVYFLYYFSGQWFMLDDYDFLRQAEFMLASGYTPWTLLTTQFGRDLLIGQTNGQSLYPFMNVLAQWMFGRAYWAPVFLNVLLTFVAGYFSARTLEDLGFPQRYVKGYLVFFLLHVELLAWSSIINMKDFVVLALASISLRNLVLLIKLYQERSAYRFGVYLRKAAVQILIFGVVFFFLNSIRFYVTLLQLAALGAWGFLSLPLRWRMAILVAVPLAYRWSMRTYQAIIMYFQPREILFGLVRFPLTPRPWSIQPNYTFLFLPSIVHWMLFVPSVIAAVALWIRVPLARLPILYLVVVIVFFAVVPEVQGPRHRVQVLPLLAWLEFHALWLAFAAEANPARTVDAAAVAHA